MNAERLAERLKQIVVEQLPLPGAGNTAERHSRLMQIGREDLSLAKLAEAHWDAVAILAEAGRPPTRGALYAVWASEISGKALRLEETDKWIFERTPKKLKGTCPLGRPMRSLRWAMV